VAESRDETRQLLKTLKHLFKAAGLRYADIAARLGVSEGTIKRYLNQQGLTVQVLQLLCECADVTLAELAKLAAEENTPVQPAATPDQERQLAGDIILSMTFFLLARGWRPEQIARESRATAYACYAPSHATYPRKVRPMRWLPGACTSSSIMWTWRIPLSPGPAALPGFRKLRSARFRNGCTGCATKSSNLANRILTCRPNA
jgi:transcriptional regulator with XRE-family HTH domain